MSSHQRTRRPLPERARLRFEVGKVQKITVHVDMQLATSLPARAVRQDKLATGIGDRIALESVRDPSNPEETHFT